MDPIEKAIRNALEKGDADDRAFREKVYRSAFAALDRALQANPGITVEAAIRRRKAMQAKIAEIESEFLPAVPDLAAAPADPSNVVPQVEVPAQAAPDVGAPELSARSGSRSEPPFGDASGPAPGPRQRIIPKVPDIMPEPVLAGSASAERQDALAAEVEPDRDPRRARRRFPLTATFLGVTVLAAVGIGLWWAVQTGAFKTLEELGQHPAPPPTVSDEDYTPPDGSQAPRKPGDGDQARDWIGIFTPADPSKVSVPAGAKADALKDDSGAFLRIRSGPSGAAVTFDVGQGVLDQIAGKHAIFDVIARAEDGKDTQMTVDCDFGELGDCGRKRYAVGRDRNEYLFEVQVPDKRAAAGGTIAIDSDFDKQGKAVDIYEIRVSTQP